MSLLLPPLLLLLLLLLAFVLPDFFVAVRVAAAVALVWQSVAPGFLKFFVVRFLF